MNAYHNNATGFDDIIDKEACDEFFEFVRSHGKADTKALLLKYSGKGDGFPLDFAITQIESRRKCRKKLEGFISNPNFIFPDALASEQSTDEAVAAFHASLVGEDMDVLDMTAGLGIDAMTIAKRGNRLTACEMIPQKATALKHNSGLLALPDFTVFCTDCIEFLKESKRRYDVIFIDPARRKSDNSRAYSYRDCEPDILGILDSLLAGCDRLMIKSSPLLDVTQVLREIPQTEKVYIVSLNGECKELLVVARKDSTFQGVEVVSISTSGQSSTKALNFTKEELKEVSAPIAQDEDFCEGMYLYEPDAALMKVSASGALCSRFYGMKKVGVNTSLYISSVCHFDFPGRIVRIKERVDKSTLKNKRGSKLNVSVRNYPVAAEMLRKKYGLKEGDNEFLYAFRATIKDTPIMLLASRISIENKETA